MGLREQIEADLGYIIEGDALGFGWPITVTNPDGENFSFSGLSDDIAQLIDPETGMLVSGRMASVAIRISSIYAQGLPIPKAISDTSGKPWLITFLDINGISCTFKIAQSNPDRAIGLVTFLLENYKTA